MEWYGLFRPHILDRGAEYHQDGYVTKFQLTDDYIEAEVEGTETYNVEIELDGEKVIHMFCDCPYAEGGSNCKHMAAVLFRFEGELFNKDLEFDSEDIEDEPEFLWEKRFKARRDEVINLVNKIPEKELRNMMVGYVLADGSLKNKLQLKYSTQFDAKQMLDLKQEINDMVNSNSVRGFVDWYHADDFTTALSCFLKEKVKPLIERNYLQQAFELTNTVFHCIGNIDMDDSSGSSAYVANVCYECWKEILRKSDESHREKMKGWFEKHRNGYVIDFMQEYLEEFLFSEFLSEKLIQEKIDELDELIGKSNGSHDCPRFYSVHYGYENAIVKRMEYMRMLNCAEEEISAFRKKNRRFFVIREMEIQEALEEKNYEGAKQLLLESIKFDEAYPRQVQKYHDELIDLYEATGDQDEYIKELQLYLGNYSQRDLSYFHKLKNEVDKTQDWEGIVEKIIHTSKDIHFICSVLSEEKRYPELIDKIKANNSVYLMDAYEKILKNVLPEEVIAFYRKYVLEEVQRVSDRNGYRHLMAYMKKIKKCPKGKDIASAIAQQWRVEYRRRPAMMDELNRIGL